MIPDAMPRLLAINGCYRENSVIDQAVSLAVQATLDAGATTEISYLRDLPIREILDCRQCTQRAGDIPVECMIRNHMQELLEQIETADGFILASPANFYTATSVFMHFMARLMEYARKQRGMDSPSSGDQSRSRPALLISTSATPGLIGRLYFSTQQQLKETARTLGAKPAGSVFVELIAEQEHVTLPDKTRRQLQYLAGRLLRQ